MKNKDQKSLEKIYESMIDGEFVFLEEEKQFAKLCAEELYEALMDESETSGFRDHLILIYDLLYPKLASPYGAMNPVSIVVPKLNLGSISKKFQTLYDVFVQREVAKHTYIGKLNAHKTILEFHNPFDNFDIETVILHNDREKFIEAFEKHLRLNIEFTFTDPSCLRDILNTEPDWKDVYLWREEKLKFQKLKDKLPEVEGLFD